MSVEDGVSAIKIDNSSYCNFTIFSQNRPDRNEISINSVVSLINGSNYNIISGTYKFIDKIKSEDTIELQNELRLIGSGN